MLRPILRRLSHDHLEHWPSLIFKFMKKLLLLLPLAFAFFCGALPAHAGSNSRVPGQAVSNGISNGASKTAVGQNAASYTPLAGQSYKGTILGYKVTVRPRNRRSETAWDIGAALAKPVAEGSAVLPIGSIYLWRHPDDFRLFRARLTVFDNNLFLSRSPAAIRPLEWVATFENYTVPFPQAQLVDGTALKSQELLWGYAMAGFGIGYRRQVYPGKQDNMLALDLTAEPGYLFFGRGSRTAQDFVAPGDTFEVRGHLQFRLDELVRNILELPHRGIAAGADIIYGHRLKWSGWGINGYETGGRDYYLFTGYLVAAGGVPGLHSGRHRLIGALHGGSGIGLDRFSVQRIGGGLNPMGEEYGSTWRPVLPGAVLQEFFPKRYIIATGEYRWEPVFFMYLGLNASAAWLDRLRMEDGWPVDKDGFFSSLGARLTTGFLLHTRLQLAYNYNFSVIRKGRYGGGEIVVSVAGSIR